MHLWLQMENLVFLECVWNLYKHKFLLIYSLIMDVMRQNTSFVKQKYLIVY